jgi:hypothetical protein
MSAELFIEGRKLISSKQLSKITGYTHDYIGRLCREGKVFGRRIGRTWFVDENAVRNYKKETKENHSARLKEAWKDAMVLTKESAFVQNDDSSMQNEALDISLEDNKDTEDTLWESALFEKKVVPSESLIHNAPKHAGEFDFDKEQKDDEIFLPSKHSVRIRKKNSMHDSYKRYNHVIQGNAVNVSNSFDDFNKLYRNQNRRKKTNLWKKRSEDNNVVTIQSPRKLAILATGGVFIGAVIAFMFFSSISLDNNLFAALFESRTVIENK